MSRSPLNALKAFEAAARLGSLTRAADELFVTQAAVSRQVRTLEEYLEVRLFQRGHRSIHLTPEGKQLFSRISGPFSDIDDAVAQIGRRHRRSTLTMRTYVTLAQRWLIRRLAVFHQKFPDVEVFLSASSTEFDFERDHIDAAISYVTDTSTLANVNYDFVIGHDITPVCSPELAREAGDDMVAFLQKTTLLHSIARPQNWSAWLRSADLLSEVDPEKGLKFESSSMAYDAAIHGMGVAMGVVAFTADDIRAGKLVAPFAHMHRHGSYYFVSPPSQTNSRPLTQFRSWLIEEALRGDATPLDRGEPVKSGDMQISGSGTISKPTA